MHFCVNLLLLSLLRIVELPFCCCSHKSSFEMGVAEKIIYSLCSRFSALSQFLYLSYIVVHKTSKVDNIDQLNHLHSDQSQNIYIESGSDIKNDRSESDHQTPRNRVYNAKNSVTIYLYCCLLAASSGLDIILPLIWG